MAAAMALVMGCFTYFQKSFTGDSFPPAEDRCDHGRQHARGARGLACGGGGLLAEQGAGGLLVDAVEVGDAVCLVAPRFE